MNIATTSSTSPLVPDVSVIIPTYNRITLLEDALASLYAQEYDGTVEIIVIDDNSQDNTTQIIREKYPDIRLIALPDNKGPSNARNQGILTAKGKFVAFLDSDDLWEPDYLQSQIALLRNDAVSDTKKCFGVSDIILWKMLDDKKHRHSQKPKSKYSSALHHLLAGGSFVSTPSAVVFPKHILDEIGLFDDSLRLGEDTDLYTRALVAGFQPVFTENASVIRRKHGYGQAMNIKNIDHRIQNRLNALKKYYPSAQQTLGDIRPRRIHSEIYSDFSRYYYEEGLYFDWLKLLFISSGYTSPVFVIRDNQYYIKKFIKKIIGR